MAYSFADQFWAPQSFDLAQRCVCRYHSDLLGFNVWVSTDWRIEDPDQPNPPYLVTAVPNPLYCRDEHGPNAKYERNITRQAWENADPSEVWDFFPEL